MVYLVIRRLAIHQGRAIYSTPSTFWAIWSGRTPSLLRSSATAATDYSKLKLVVARHRVRLHLSRMRNDG